MVDGSTDHDPYPTEADIDAILVEFDGDPRAAIRALLQDLDVLARDYEASVSKGYVRGHFPERLTRTSR